MSSSSVRGQTEPVAALLAVIVVAAGLALYAGVLDDALDLNPERDVTAATLEQVESHLTPAGVVRPGRLDTVDRATPAGYDANVTVTVGDRQWATGPVAPGNAETAARTVSVRTAPATVHKGRLRVAIWK